MRQEYYERLDRTYHTCGRMLDGGAVLAIIAAVLMVIGATYEGAAGAAAVVLGFFTAITVAVVTMMVITGYRKWRLRK